MSDGVLDLYALRSRQCYCSPVWPHRSPAPAAPGGQPPLSAESGRPARPPGSSASQYRGPEGTPAGARPPRDGSIFPFGHFSGTNPAVEKRSRRRRRSLLRVAPSTPAGEARRCLAALARSVAAQAASLDPFSTHPTTKVSLMISPETRVQIRSLFLRRALENRHHCTSPQRPPRHRTACPLKWMFWAIMVLAQAIGTNQNQVTSLREEVQGQCPFDHIAFDLLGPRPVEVGHGLELLDL